MTPEQREALRWAADRAHVASLGKPITSPEWRRFRLLAELARDTQPDERAAFEGQLLALAREFANKYSGASNANQLQAEIDFCNALREFKPRATAQQSERPDERAAFQSAHDLTMAAFHREVDKQFARATAPQATQMAGYCRQGEHCVCGGDLASVREGCSEWVQR